MDTTIKGANGNSNREANFNINILDAEILRRKDYLGAPILDQPWIGVASTLQIAVTSQERDGTTITAHSDTYTALVDQPLRDFMDAAMVQYQAIMTDVKTTYSIVGDNAYRVDLNAQGINGSFAGALKAGSVLLTGATLVFVAPS